LHEVLPGEWDRFSIRLGPVELVSVREIALYRVHPTVELILLRALLATDLRGSFHPLEDGEVRGDCNEGWVSLKAIGGLIIYHERLSTLTLPDASFNSGDNT
jgi:hypothetical protein